MMARLVGVGWVCVGVDDVDVDAADADGDRDPSMAWAWKTWSMEPSMEHGWR